MSYFNLFRKIGLTSVLLLIGTRISILARFIENLPYDSIRYVYILKRWQVRYWATRPMPLTCQKWILQSLWNRIGVITQNLFARFWQINTNFASGYPKQWFVWNCRPVYLSHYSSLYSWNDSSVHVEILYLELNFIADDVLKFFTTLKIRFKIGMCNTEFI